MSNKPDWMAPLGPPWTIQSTRKVYENPWIAVHEHHATAPTGRPALYGVVSFRNDCLAIVPLHADGTVTLVGQHRFPVPGYSWEIPEGGGPIGEDPLAGAQRELREETGLVARDWREVLRFQLSNSITDERGFGYIALDLEQVEVDPDETEALKITRIPFHEALQLALSGAIFDMPTVAMLLRAYHMAREGELPEELAGAMLNSVGHP